MTRTLDVTVRHVPPVAILDLKGEMMTSSKDSFDEFLEKAYAEVEKQNDRMILLNFKQVGFLNSRGIAFVIGLIRRGRAAGRVMMACCLTPHYVRIFQISRLNDYIQVFPDEPAALDAAQTLELR